jgi:hypothetical protein
MLPNLAFHFSIGLNARHVVVPTMINQIMVVFGCDKKWVEKELEMKFFKDSDEALSVLYSR